MQLLDKLIKFREDEFTKKMWKIIFDIGWGVRTIDYNQIKKYLNDNYTEFEIKRMKNFIVYKRKELQDRIRKYEKDTRTKVNRGGDDSFWDLCAHIVGLGKERYNSVMNNPEIAKDISMNLMYMENFEYAFRIDK